MSQNTDGCKLTLPSQTLAQYTSDCQKKVGGLIATSGSSWFDCDAGSEVDEGNEMVSPMGYPHDSCDRPNVLRSECDPKSKFQVLPSSNINVLMVAHCRKRDNVDGQYGDIAVIEYDKVTGNTCFFQSPVVSGLSSKVPMPSDPAQTFWQTPAVTASQNCVSCHDNGPFIRSPYLTHLKDDPAAVAKGNVLPGSHLDHWNDVMPYHFVGNDFQSWKTFSISAANSTAYTCANCHRMAISAHNGLFNPGFGTSEAFALTATSQGGQPHKNPTAPFWMLLFQPVWDMGVQAQAQVFKDCGDAIINGTSSPWGCGYTEFGRGETCTGPVDGGVINGSISGDDPSFHYQSQQPTGFSNPNGSGPGIPAFVYWETLHGPFWQTSPSTVPLGSTNYRGSYLRVIINSDGYFTKDAYSDSTGSVKKAAPGGHLEGVAFADFVTHPVSVTSCMDSFSTLTDPDGTHTYSFFNIGPPNQYVESLTSLIGNVAQTVTPRPDFLRVDSNGAYAELTQTHTRVTSGPLLSGFLRAESYAATCSGWSPTYLARNVFSTNDVLLLANPSPKIARCFISGVSGSWSSSRINGTQHSEPFAAVYQNANGDYHLKVGRSDTDVPLPADRVGAYGSCIQL